jgi:sulfatase maturation enzyme AslB (radical SAM superfamily)
VTNDRTMADELIAWLKQQPFMQALPIDGRDEVPEPRRITSEGDALKMSKQAS